MIASVGLLTAVLVIGGVAWYTRVSNISGLTLDVAGFDVRANYMNGKFLANAEDYMNVQLNKAAPGTIGCLPVLITTQSETEVQYAITLDLKGVAPEILERLRFFYYDRTENAAYVEWLNWKDYQEAVAAGTDADIYGEGEGKKAIPTAKDATKTLYESWAAWQTYQAALAAGTAADTYGEGKTPIPTDPTASIPTPVRTYLGGVRYVYPGIYATGTIDAATDVDTGEATTELHYHPTNATKAKQITDATDTTSALGYVPIGGTLGTTDSDKREVYEYIYWEWVYEFDTTECYNLETGKWGTTYGDAHGTAVYPEEATEEQTKAVDDAVAAYLKAAAERYDRIDSNMGLALLRHTNGVTGNWYDKFVSEIDSGNFTKDSGTVTVTDKEGKQTQETIAGYQNAIMVKVLVTGAQATPKEGEAANYAAMTTPLRGEGSTVYLGPLTSALAE